MRNLAKIVFFTQVVRKEGSNAKRCGASTPRLHHLLQFTALNPNFPFPSGPHTNQFYSRRSLAPRTGDFLLTRP